MTTISTYGPTGNTYIDGVLSGVKWAVSSLSYSFPTSASFYGSGYGNGEPANHFAPLNATQQNAVRTVLGMYSAVANVTFNEVTETAGSHAELRYAESDSPGTSWAYYQSTNASGGDVWIGNSTHWYDNPVPGNYAWATMIHETGHAMGLKHPHETGSFGAMPVDHDSLEYSIMSYRSYIGGSTSSGYTNGASGYPQTLMMYDIAALQAMYGANYASHGGDTTYRWDPTTGQESVNGVGQVMAPGNKIFMTLWDGGGNDTYDFSGYTTNLAVDLNPGAWSTTSATQLAALGYGHNAAGNIANALLYNGNTASLIENVVGGSGADTMVGNGADNQLTGGRGNDTIDGRQGTDTAWFSGNLTDYTVLHDGDGSWTFTDAIGSDRTDTLRNIEFVRFANTLVNLDGFVSSVLINGTAGNDIIDGTHTPAGQLLPGADDDTINGNGGNDILAGLGGADTLNGGLGLDTASYAASAAGVNVSLVTGLGQGGDAEGDTLIGIENLTGSGLNDVLEGDAGSNVLIGGNGVDTVTYKSATAAVTVSLAIAGSQNTIGAGVDSLATFENLTGSAYGDRLIGSTTGNMLSGLAGNDVLDGGAGSDTMVGGSGNDTYVVDGAGDVADETGGDGFDLVQSAITFNLSDGVHALGVIEDLTLILAGNVNATGSAFANVLTGNSGNNVLAGLGGADTLVGGAGIDTASYAASAAGVMVSLVTGLGQGGDAEGDVLTGVENLLGSTANDTLEGNSAANILTGGAGIDMVSYAHATSAVTVSLAVSIAQNTLGAGSDTLLTFENLTGSAFADKLTGSSADNLLIGLAGNDSLAGGSGADMMVGGTGSDTYVIDNAGDVADETGGDGTDLVQSSISFSLSDGVHAVGVIENLTLTLSGNVNGTGTAFANVITGNGGNNLLAGLGGADTLIGGLGLDTATYAASAAGVDVSLATGLGLGGDAAGDSLSGFENLTGSDSDDTLEGNAVNNLLVGGVGFDTVSYAHATAGVTVSLAVASAQNTIGAGSDTLTSFENLIGSAFDDKLTGSGADNRLTGLDGNDLLAGGGGADAMIGGNGIDTASYALSAAGVDVSLTTGLGHGGDAESDTLIGIENLIGSGFNDTLEGSGGNDALTGLAGADALIGQGGIDLASYAASTMAVDVSLATGLGHGGDAEGDTLAGVENLTGSGFNDVLEGDFGDNLLIGGAGIDTVSYRNAAGQVTVGLAVTAAQNTGGGGTDTLATLENLIGSAFGDTLTGSSAANVLTGLAGSDSLDAGAGADKMIGGTGSDTYVVENAGDVVDETGGDGTDLVQSSVTFSLSDPSHAIGAIENLTLTLSGNISGTGNALVNTLTGNGGNNVLAALGGADTLVGGGGTDTASYAASTAGVDVSLETGAGHGGHAEGDALFSIENLVGSGYNDSLEGDDGNNVLTGGAGIDKVSYQNATSGVTVSLAVTFAQNTIGAGIDTLATFENLTGSAFADTLTGSTVANGLVGLAGSDVLTGGAGNDTLSGGADNDKFVFAAGFGKDVITDFEAGVAGTDVIAIAHTLFADFTALIAHTLDNGVGDAVIKYDVSNTITLSHVHKADLDASDFLFT